MRDISRDANSFDFLIIFVHVCKKVYDSCCKQVVLSDLMSNQGHLMTIPADVRPIADFIVSYPGGMVPAWESAGVQSGLDLGLLSRWRRAIEFREPRGKPEIVATEVWLTLTPLGAELMGVRLIERTVMRGVDAVEIPYWIAIGKPEPPCRLPRRRWECPVPFLHLVRDPASLDKFTDEPQSPVIPHGIRTDRKLTRREYRALRREDDERRNSSQSD